MHEKITKIQAELKAPKGQFNKFGGYHYRSCEDILQAAKPLCNGEGLTLHLQDEIVEVGSRIYVKATAWVSDGEGKVECVAFAREGETKKGMDEAQITGAASSYARKYALNGLFAIDDAKDSDTSEHAKQMHTTVPSASQPSDKHKIMHNLKRLTFTIPEDKSQVGPYVRDVVKVLTGIDITDEAKLPAALQKLEKIDDPESARSAYGIELEERARRQYEGMDEPAAETSGSDVTNDKPASTEAA